MVFELWFLSYKILSIRDGHTHWVMDIQPYPIQMFWIILSSSWVELNRVGYRYYPNCSSRVWILSKPDPLKKKKKKAGRMVTYCSIVFGFSISKLCTNYSCTGMNILWLIVVLYFPLFFFNLFVLWDAFMICNYIPAKLLNFFFNHLKVWLPYCLRKFLWTSLSAAPDFEKKRKQRALKS